MKIMKSRLTKFLALLVFSALNLSVNIAVADVVDIKDSELTMNAELSKDIDQTLKNLRYYHYVRTELNDDLSSRILDGYLQTLDPNKLYFNKRDIDSFQDLRFKLDDMLKKRNAEVAFDIYKVFRQRVKEQTKLAVKLVDYNYDFSKQETIDIDRDNYVWSKSKTQLQNRWRKRIKNDYLQQLLAQTPEDEIKDNLRRRYARQKDVIFQYKADDVFELFMNAYARELGPHTQYMSHITAENFRTGMSLSLQGIGAALQSEQDYTVINRIVKGGPAERSGLLNEEDKIIGVGQQGEKIINVIGWRLMDVVQMIRGDKGSKVRLQIQKHDSVPGSPPVEIELVRDIIHLEDQAVKLSQVELESDGDKQLFSVISIPSFYSNSGDDGKYVATAHDVRQLLKQVNKADNQGLIIDLRGNGGGYLNEAINLTGLFIDQGPVVQVSDSLNRSQVLKDTNDGVAYSGPLAVLVDRYSASASEIFAAAIQDYGRGIIIGERSFGKGTVQRVAPLRSGNQVTHQSQVKFTTAQFFRVNGGSTQHKGVVPDVTLQSGDEDTEFGERAYDNALPWSQTKAAVYKPYTIPADLIEYLNQQHKKRAETSSAFTWLRATSAQLVENRELKSLSLNLQERQALRDKQESQSINRLNTYRDSLGLQAVSTETRSDNPLPGEDEHWNQVFHKEAARILNDHESWIRTALTRHAAADSTVN